MMRLVVIVTLVFGAQAASAQDYIYSQFANEPLLLNPALTGVIEQDYRASIGYRNQWASIGNSFRTTSAAFDMPMLRKRGSQNQLGVGGYVLSDKAGKSSMGLLQASGSVSYLLGMNDYNSFSTGIQVAYAERSIDLNGLAWDSQYNGVGYDPLLPTMEQFANDKRSYVDFSLGLLWKHEKNLNYSLGYSLWHYGQPQGFLNGRTDRLFMRHVLHASLENSWKYVDVVSRLKTEVQSGALEFTGGFEVKYRTGTDSRYTDYRTSSAVMAGLYYRVGDALTPMVGYEFRRMVYACFSYDINVSRLNSATMYQGGWEFHLQHTGFLTQKRRRLR